MKTIQLIWYILKLLIFWFIGFLYFILAVTVSIFNLWRAQKIFYNFLHLFLKAFGITIQYQFSQKKTVRANNTVFVLLNQSSFLDSLIPPPIHKIRGIINIEFALYPIIGWFLAITNFVIIRQLPKQAKNTLNRTGEFLKSGGNMFISIEGKRSKDGKLNEYKKGPIVMAINNQSDIVPMIINGTFESLPYGSLYIKPGNVKMIFFDPISTKDMSYVDRNTLRDKLLSLAHENGL
tara:strand:+ start:2363 stop:3067 length:705 start_codon:yes stop_codon:yes gene_type:complete